MVNKMKMLKNTNNQKPIITAEDLIKLEDEIIELKIEIAELDKISKTYPNQKYSELLGSSSVPIVVKNFLTKIINKNNINLEGNQSKIEKIDLRTKERTKEKTKENAKEKKILVFVDLPNIETSYFKKTNLKGGYYKQLKTKIIEFYKPLDVHFYVFTTPNHRLPDYENANEHFKIINLKKYGDQYADIDSDLLITASHLLHHQKKKIAKFVLCSGDKDFVPLLKQVKDELGPSGCT